MIQTLFNLFLRCSHKKMTFPLTPAGRSGGAAAQTYIVCLDCGRRFGYDWDRMRVIWREKRSRTPLTTLPDLNPEKQARTGAG